MRVLSGARRGGTARLAGLLVLVTVAATAAHVWYGNRHHFYDLSIYRAAMQWWAGGHPLYDFAQPDATQGHLEFTYPPFAALVLRPLAWLSWNQTMAVYTVVAAAAFAVSMWWLVRPVADRHGWPRWFAVGFATVLATTLEPVREAFTLGQVNFVLWALILLDLLVLLPADSARTRAFAGVGIGFATAIKLIPGIFILYLLVTRRWRAAGVAAATAMAATALAAAVAPQDTWTYLTREVFDAGGVGQLAYPFNQSLLGLLARLALPGEPDGRVWLLLALAALGYGMWRAARAGIAGDEVAGLSLTGLAGSLISPITWTHHIFWFVPALVVLLDTGLAPAGAAGPVVDGLRGRRSSLLLAGVVYLTAALSLLSLWAFDLHQPGGLVGFVLSNWQLWLMLVVLVLLPIRRGTPVAAGAPVAGTAAQVAV